MTSVGGTGENNKREAIVCERCLIEKEKKKKRKRDEGRKPDRPKRQELREEKRR